MLEARLPYLRTTQDPPRMKQKVKLWSRGWGPCLWTLRLLNPCPNAQCTEHLSIGSTPSSNSHHQHHYIFSRESLSTFMCHYYWVGSRSNLSTYGLPSNVPRNPIMFAIKEAGLSFGIAGLGPFKLYPLPRILPWDGIIDLEVPAAAFFFHCHT